VRTLGPDNVNHIQVRSVIERNIACHNEVACVLAQMVQQCGLLDVTAHTESAKKDDNGLTFDTDVRFIHRGPGDDTFIEVRTCAEGDSNAVSLVVLGRTMAKSSG